MKISPLLHFFAFGIIMLSCDVEQKSGKLVDQAVKKPQEQSIISYWDEQKKGANYFNQDPTREWFDAANNANIKFIRLAYEKWQGEQRDFLLGNADNYQGIVESDFQKLKYFLDYAHTLAIKVVIAPISLPGARWIQMNDNVRDDRLWVAPQYRKQAIQFWKDLARRLNNHPAIVGYNLVNEPHPEIHYKKHSFWNKGFQDWYKEVQGGPGDLNFFNRQMVEAIRSVDTNTPIIIESGLFATPWAFEYLEPLQDEKIIYAFHMYEPYSFTTKRINNGQYSYPGRLFIEDLGKNFQLDKKGLRDFLNPILDWSEKNRIPSNRIWVGEFGCNRSVQGAKQYLQDLISIFNENDWHWSFYAYREDVWEAMDYELGTAKVFYKYWEYQDANTLHLHYNDLYSKVKDTSLWTVFSAEFN